MLFFNAHNIQKKYRLILHTDKCPHDIEKLMFIAYN